MLDDIEIVQREGAVTVTTTVGDQSPDIRATDRRLLIRIGGEEKSVEVGAVFDPDLVRAEIRNGVLDVVVPTPKGVSV